MTYMHIIDDRFNCSTYKVPNTASCQYRTVKFLTKQGVLKMKFNRTIFVGLPIMLLAGCLYLAPPTKVFRDQMDNYYVGKPLSEYTRVYTSATIEETREVRPGVMEYYFEWGKGLHRPGKECKFIFTVEKNTEKIISWRYNGDPDNCWIAS